MSDELIDLARQLAARGLKPFDALHAASAIVANADYFCTCDDKLLRRFRSFAYDSPRVVSPLELAAEIIT